jgi:peroxiredoxin
MLTNPQQTENSMGADLIAVGQIAPDFSLAASLGPSPLGLSTLRGKTVVLAFYPLDFTDT